MTTMVERGRVPSPVGELTLAAVGGAVCALWFEGGDAGSLQRHLERRFGPIAFADTADPAGAGARLRAYLGGDVLALDGLRLDLGGTPFQRLVWDALRRIPAGSTISYAELARWIGRPKAVRAVGLANSKNPVAIAVPCHRVVAADGSLHGYAGGLDRKRWLLEHEARRGLDAVGS